MAEPLKNQFGAQVPEKIALMVRAVYSRFDSDVFLQDVLSGYDSLELTPRGWKIAHSLKEHLPSNYPEAIKIILASLGPELEGTENFGMTAFLYLPHVFFVAEYGTEHFQISMDAQYELTKRFSAEFSIRTFIEKYPDKTLARLKVWTRDENPHVRRLVSEGTRPRLPWAKRLPAFQKNPVPVIKLLELLKDDPELYVRRSVANNLNDIGKDNPAILVKTVRRWMPRESDLTEATVNRRWLIRHALRSAIKRAEPSALSVLGFGDATNVLIKDPAITPENAVIGGKVKIVFSVSNNGTQDRDLLINFRVHFVKASGKASPKVFKLKTVTLAPGETLRLAKSISLAEMTTRKHYPGTHKVEVILNGATRELGAFEVVEK